MPIPIKVLQPDYFARFHCIGSECEDTCCDGLGVAIDRPTFEKYRACTDPQLRPMLDKHIAPNPHSTSDATYGLIVVNEQHCPFLTDERWCSVQQKLGESALSRTCSVYPRAMSHVDGMLERSLYTSCPEAVRVAMLSPQPITFVEAEVEPDSHLTGFPVLDTTDESNAAKPYRHFQAVRALVFEILQDRSFSVWERLVMVGVFCDQLGQLTESAPDDADAVPALIAGCREAAARGDFAPMLAGIADRPSAQLNFTVQALDEQVMTSLTSPRFVDCYYEFGRGIGRTTESSPEEIERGFIDAKRDFYMPLMTSNEHILENWLVSAAFRSLFPFGPQTGTFTQQKSIFSEYVALVIPFVLMRTLLIGMAGYHRDRFGSEHIVKLIQSFGKAVEHNLSFTQQLRLSLEQNGLAYMAFLAALVKA